MAIGKAVSGDDPLAIDFSLSWLNPLQVASFETFTAGLSLSIFIFWGWDTCLTLNEETGGSGRRPGRAALLCVVTILSCYLLVAIAAQMFAGVGEEGYGLGNPETADNVFAALADPVLGGLADHPVHRGARSSSASSLQTTFLAARADDAGHGRLPRRARSPGARAPRFRVPSTATLVSGVGTGVFYIDA